MHLITKRQLAKKLYVTIEWLNQALEDGIVPSSSIKLGKHIRWVDENIDEWINNGCTGWSILIEQLKDKRSKEKQQVKDNLSLNNKFFCAECGSKKIDTSKEVFGFPYGIDADAVTLSCKIPLRTCLDCGYSFVDGEGETIIDREIHRYLKDKQTEKRQLVNEVKTLKKVEKQAIQKALKKTNRYYSAPDDMVIMADRTKKRIDQIKVGDEVTNEKGEVSLVKKIYTRLISKSNKQVENEQVDNEIMTLKEVEKQAIEIALEKTNGSRHKAAYLLGVGERTVYRKIKEYAIPTMRKKIVKDDFIRVFKQTNGNRQEISRLLEISITSVYKKVKEYKLQ